MQTKLWLFIYRLFTKYGPYSMETERNGLKNICFVFSESILNGECYLDNPSNLLLPDRTDYRDNTPQKCISECRKKDFSYAGVQNGVSCFCGNQSPPIRARLDGGKLVPPNFSSRCNQRCEGDHGEKCGGQNREMNVYDTGCQRNI